MLAAQRNPQFRRFATDPFEVDFAVPMRELKALLQKLLGQRKLGWQSSYDNKNGGGCVRLKRYQKTCRAWVENGSAWGGGVIKAVSKD